MGSKFLERNKKKSLLALLLLLLRWRRGTGPLLLVILLLMLVFLSPNNARPMFIRALDAIPFIGHRMAHAVARLTAGGEDFVGETDFSALSAAWRAARQKGTQSWNVFTIGGSQAGKAGGLPGDSVGMVRGNKDEMFGTGRGKGAGASGAAGGSGGSGVAGVLTRADAARMPKGVEISTEDLTGERAGFAEAAMTSMTSTGFFSGSSGQAGASGRAGKSAATTAFLAGVGPYTQVGFFSGKGSAPSQSGNLTTALKSVKVAPVSIARVAGTGDRLSQSIATRGELGSQRALTDRAISGGGTRALAQLGDARAYAMVSREPLCTVQSGCPPEYAMVNTGVVYDVTQQRDTPRVIMSGTANSIPIDGIAVPNLVNVPSTAQLHTYLIESVNIRNDAETCRLADETYTPQENSLLREYESSRCSPAVAAGCPHSDDGSNDAAYFAGEENSWGILGDICCAVSLCSSCGTYRANQAFNRGCKEMVAAVEAQCQAIDVVRAQHQAACPLNPPGSYRPRCGVPPEAGGYNMPVCN